MTNTAPPDRLILKSFTFHEAYENGDVNIDIPEVSLDSMNLFVGNNGQGKTRVLRTLIFMKSLFGKTPRRLETNFKAAFTFKAYKNNDEIGQLNYEINITPANEGNSYKEKLKNDRIIILDTTETNRKLFDETTGNYIENFFVPPSVTAISAINDDKFISIKLVREFFLKIASLADVTSSELMVATPERGTVILNSNGNNLSDVLRTWKVNKPDLYEEIIEDFKNLFRVVSEIDFEQLEAVKNIEVPRLVLKEEGVNRTIGLENWSRGYVRALCILTLIKQQFEFAGKIYPPSIICIDEVENSLDFITLKYIFNYLSDHADNSQLILTTHSPLLSQFVHPNEWHIVKRKGTTVKITRPKDIEKNLDDKLNHFKHNFWEFYVGHISGTDEYGPK